MGGNGVRVHFEFEGVVLSGDDGEIRGKGGGQMGHLMVGGPFPVLIDGGAGYEGEAGRWRRGGEFDRSLGFGSRESRKEVGGGRFGGHGGFGQREALGAAEPGRAEESSEGLGPVVAEGFAGDVGRDATVGEGEGGGDGGDVAAGGAAVEEFAGLPDGEAFEGELLGKAVGVRGGGEGFGGQNAGGLVMPVLPGIGRGIHGDDDLGAQGADEAHEFLEGFVLAPFAERGGEALGVEEVLLVEEIAVAHAEDAQGVAEFRFPEDPESRAALGADHVASAFASGDVGMGDHFLPGMSVVGQGGGHAGFVVGMGEDAEDICFEQGGALGRRVVGSQGQRRGHEPSERQQPTG